MKGKKPMKQTAMKKPAAVGVMKAPMKTAIGVTGVAMGTRGVKNAAFLKLQAGPRKPFWYGESKVFTQYKSASHGRWRVYKKSPQDKVESSFGYHDHASRRDQWSAVVALLKHCNP